MKRRISIARKTLARRGRKAGLGLALLSGFAASAHAFDDKWTGTTSGDWNTASNWSTGVPGGADTATITSTTNNPVTITGVNPTISNLTLSTSGNSLNVGAGLSLEVQGAAASISNAGTITLGGGGAELRTSGVGTITLTGTGSLVLGGDGNNLIRDPFNSTGKLINVGNTISGVGKIGSGQLSLDNQAAGTVSANVNGKTLTIQPNGNGVSNEGLMQAAGGGTLQLLGGNFTNTGGTVKAGDTSAVLVNASFVAGGTLATAGSGVIHFQNQSELGSITSTGALQVDAGHALYLANGSTLTNQGTLTLAGGSAELRVVGTGSATLGGGGTVLLGGDGNNLIRDANNATGSITNHDNTIHGAGNIGNGQLSFDNQAAGTITADNAAHILILQPNGNGFKNEGLMQATSGATLELNGGNFTNTGGTIKAGDTSSVLVNASLITGGTLATAGSGVIHFQNQSELGSITSTGALQVDTGHVLFLANGSTLTNQGTLTLAGGGAELRVVGAGSATLGGGGTVFLGGDGNNLIRDANNATGSITNVDNTIHGAGNIGNGQLSFDNKAAGTITADNSAHTLILQPNANGFSNEGLMQATSGATLELNGGNFTNSASGVIKAGDTSSVLVNASFVAGGTLATAGSGVIHFQNSSELGTITSTGALQVDTGHDLYLANTSTLTNQGTLTLAGAGAELRTVGQGTATLAGGGTILLGGDGNNLIRDANNATGSITNQDNTIHGAGNIGNGQLSLDNQAAGTITADNAAHALILQPNGNGFKNEGLMQATSGATLELRGGSFTNTGGTIKAGDTSSVLVNASFVAGGTLATAGSGVVHFENSSELGSITSTGALQVDAGHVLFLANKATLTNQGTLTLAGGGAELRTVGNGSATLAGGGTVFLGGDGNNLIRDASNATGSITNVDNTIHGAGNIGDGQLSFDNQLHGTIIADNAAHALVISPNGSGVSNEGTFQANSGSELEVTGKLTNFNATNGTLTGGTYNVLAGAGTAIFQFNNGGFANDLVTNAATILLDGAASRFWDQGGPGTNALAHFATNAAAGSFTIQDGRNLTTPGDFSNAGIVHIGATSTFNVGSGGANSYTQTAGTTQVDGVLHASLTTIAGGTLSGTGTVMGNVSNTGGTVMPGTPGVAGVLTITGNYTDPPSSHLFIQIGGPDPLHGLSQLDVGGTASLNNGTLDLSLINGFTPTDGELFTILTSGGLTGTFNDNTIVDGNVTFHVEYSPPGFANDVVLMASVNTPVPEPASVVLLGAGAVGLLAYGRHRGRRAGA